MSQFQFIGSTVIHLTRVDSTNNYARSFVRDKTAIEGTVVVADEQTDGRGQRANSWLTEPKKNLTCSYILKPVFLAAKDQFMLSATVALALFDTVSHFLPKSEIHVKWPNDVLIGRKKIAGILIENSLRGSNLETSIVGIGLNVNQSSFAKRLNATSIGMTLNEDVQLASVLIKLNEYLEKRYLYLREGKFASILENLNSKLYGTDQELSLTINGEAELVRIVGVLHSGELQLEHAEGSRTLHQHHEIAWHLS